MYVSVPGFPRLLWGGGRKIVRYPVFKVQGFFTMISFFKGPKPVECFKRKKKQKKKRTKNRIRGGKIEIDVRGRIV